MYYHQGRFNNIYVSILVFDSGSRLNSRQCFFKVPTHQLTKCGYIRTMYGVEYKGRKLGGTNRRWASPQSGLSTAWNTRAVKQVFRFFTSCGGGGTDETKRKTMWRSPELLSNSMARLVPCLTCDDRKTLCMAIRFDTLPCLGCGHKLI